MDKQTQTEIRLREESLWRAQTRFDNAMMDATFSDDFCEFGKSGKIHTRANMFCPNGSFSEIQATLPLPNFKAKFLTPDVIQVTYTSEVICDGQVEQANRSSIWSQINGTWRLRFHQATPVKSRLVAQIRSILSFAS